MFLQRQLAEAKSDLQVSREKQVHEARLREIELAQTRERHVRLENIVGACVEHMLSRGGLPNFLRKMIEHDAPGALLPSCGGHTTNYDLTKMPDLMSHDADQNLSQSLRALPRTVTATQSTFDETIAVETDTASILDEPCYQNHYHTVSTLNGCAMVNDQGDHRFFTELLNEGQL